MTKTKNTKNGPLDRTMTRGEVVVRLGNWCRNTGRNVPDFTEGLSNGRTRVPMELRTTELGDFLGMIEMLGETARFRS